MKRKDNSWLGDQNQCHVPVSRVLVQANVLSIYENLSKDDDDDDKPFCTSTVWFSKFMKRYNFYNIKTTWEVASTETVVAEKFFIVYK